jgi:hypothetical protein
MLLLLFDSLITKSPYKFNMTLTTNLNNFKIIDKKYQLKEKSLGSGSFGQIFLT